MGRSKEQYFQRFLDFLNSLKEDSVVMSVSEIREKLGKDENSNWILCDTADEQYFWGINEHHRFPYFISNRGWNISTHFINGVKEITFIKNDYKKNQKQKSLKIKELECLNVDNFIKYGNDFEISFKESSDPKSPNYHVVPGHEREKSWDYCYEAFGAINKDNPDIDYLCLHLAFYLASWGMYRGSTFLFRNDYKVHENVVKKIVEYKSLRNQIPSQENINEIMELVDFIKTGYGPTNHPTKTLITKILLGTLGCSPAYDTYVCETMKKYLGFDELNNESLLSLGLFYKQNIDVIESKKCNKKYPPMKFLDMSFFRESYDGKIDDETADEK